MHRPLFYRDSLAISSRTFLRPLSRTQSRPVFSLRSNSTQVEAKYAEKLIHLAKEKGLSLSELKEKARAEQAEKQRQQKVIPGFPTRPPPSSLSNPYPSSSDSVKRNLNKERKDSAPVRPLSSLLNVERLFSVPHTTEQATSLWTAYHLSRSNGTGRGYICASIPLEVYQRLEKVARKYPSFVIALPRPRQDDTENLVGGGSHTAYEFYFLQWLFHDKPPVPKVNDNPFDIHPLGQSTNPQTSTILFTPLEEYKLRGEYATPYLIQTHYTDLASTHGIVLMRGEITPSSSGLSGSPDRYLLTQEDAQLLAIAVQKFYLWNDTEGGENCESATLLRTFHEKSGDFNWQDLLKAATLI